MVTYPPTLIVLGFLKHLFNQKGINVNYNNNNYLRNSQRIWKM